MQRPLEEMVKLAAAGNADAFAAVIAHTQRQALAVAMAVCGNADLAGDVVQEAYIRAWRRLDALQNAQRFMPWFLQIIRHLATDQKRQQKPLAELDEMAFALADPGRPPDQRLHEQDQQRLLDAAIARLDEISRAVIMLRYYSCLESKEIAAVLEMSPAAVDMRLSRARDQLRKDLQTVECFDAKH